MGSSIKKEWILEGLDCSNCAAKIEKEITGIDGVKSVSINFISKKLIIESENTESDFTEIFNKAKSIVNRIEANVKIIESEEEIKDEDEELKERKINIIKLILSGILFLTALIFDFNKWTELAIYLMSFIIIGAGILLRAVKNIIKGQIFDENFLMSIATVGAFIIGEYPEGVAVMLFYQVGELFQDIAVNNSRKSIKALMNIRPDYANLKVNNENQKVSPSEVKIGDIIIVKPGEKIPLDGKVIEGASMVDTSAITGESVPREANEGCEVYSGSINKNGILIIEVLKEFGESTVSKIISLVQNASSRKAPTENFITKFARYYTPIVVFTALFLAVLPPLIIPGAQFIDWIYRALMFLVISCPCALVISIPLGFFGGIGGASKKGILIKGSNYLEALNNIETIIFDKTGTLTKGVFKVTELKPDNNFTKEQLLEFAAYAESYSSHPIALSIISAFEKEINKSKIENYDEISGYGIRAKVNGKEILAGNIKLMNKENIIVNIIDSIGTVVYLAVNNIYAGYIVISDEIKEDSEKAIKDLKSLGIKKTVMLTGDVSSVGTYVGKRIGIDEVYSELLPSEKVTILEEIDSNKSANKKLVFVGDGINDSPALARADIGIAMGGLGSDAAIEAADIVIMTDEPSKLISAIKIAKRTGRIVWQNIIFALSVKFIFLVLGAFGITTMWQAVFADVGVSVIAILNAMRVMNVNKI